MNKVKNFLREYFETPDFMKRLVVMLIGVFLMGFFLSFLIKVDLGTDPCTFMNLTISRKLGILFGTWQLALNAVLFVIVILFGKKCIGFGTIANMVFIGYIADFFGWLWDKTIPERYFTEFPSRAVIFALALLLFIISVSFYINADMGVSPYDAMPQIISDRVLTKVPYYIIRIGYDFLVIVIGVMFGGTPNIGIILMALFLGPIISVVGKFLGKHVFHLN
ncbi:Uncharacterized membrane protein YczE [Butyrivibrio hungatei DSM 14810]|uniref:Uncharacterized membrane protein YczE n=1 Tax=Butyrivibrio hungatei DSM 14810 TaxID=1121132 RepID=A0A1M7SIF7_9FIRM|nr:hypothetical protein [Butyrivibrio hungatei]SHN58249.1 Uncharacterized membrane protein YczE [Butyrivibrio hungatei DSM 14810]